MFMLRMKVREWMDPATPAVLGLEGHHLFPREYQRTALGIRDNKRINIAIHLPLRRRDIGCPRRCRPRSSRS